MKTKLFFMVIAFVVAMAGGSLYAIAAGNVGGWLWGGSDNAGISTGMGWISMNSDNCDPNGDGISETGLTNNPDFPSCPDGMPVGNFGVDIPDEDGSVTGYAWSENYGWIDFDPGNNCTTGVAGTGKYRALSCAAPGGGIAGVERSGNALINYARVVGIAQAGVTDNNGGWDGWIQMDPATSGVTIDPSTGQLSGYAWSGEYDLVGTLKEGIGWIDFSLASIVLPKELIVCQLSCDSGNKVADSLSLIQGNSKDVVACYTNTQCAEAMSNVTSDPLTTWAEEVDGVVSLRSTDPEQIHADQGSNGTETIKVEYAAHVKEFNVVVLGSLCGNGSIEAGEECDNGVENGGCPSRCSSSCTTNACGNKFKEIAP